MTDTVILSGLLGVGVALLLRPLAALERWVRQATGVGLKEAKDVVDEIRRRAPAYRAVDAGQQA